MLRRGSTYVVGCLLCVTVIFHDAFGQSGTQASDSLKTYRLSEIVVGADTDRSPSMETVRKIPISAIVREDAPAVSELMRLIPSAFVQTNSRGETLVYMRGAGERQVAVFFDGALLNIPWDNRVDISLIPAGMLGGMEVSRGIPSVLYGTNVIGGALNLQTRSLDGPGSHVDIGLQLGSKDARMLHGTYLRKSRSWSAVASGSLFATDGQTIPSGARIAFNQNGSNVRANTDRRIGNLFLRLGHHLSDQTEVGLSLVRIDSEKGIAPEGHLDPSQDMVRFWRYPLWRNTMLILNAISETEPDGFVHATVWLGRFGQHIEQYASGAYESVSDLQQDQDDTVGLRLSAGKRVGRGSLRGAVNGLYSRHDQTDIGFGPDGSVDAVLERRFAQMLFAVGLEYEENVGTHSTFQFGASLDGSASPMTGDKPPRDPDLAVGLTGGFRVDLGERRTLRWSIGRKVRFPTMRELFGEALQRFVLNADLKEESSLLSEVALESKGEIVSGEVIVFYRRTFDTIDQEIVDVAGVQRRKRINLDGSSALGVEVGGTAKLMRRFTVDGHLSLMDLKGIENGQRIKLNEKPGMLARFALLYTSGWGGSFQAAWIATGSSWALAGEGEQVQLPSSSVFNFRSAYRRYFETGGVFVEFFVGVTNVGNVASFSQIGLPNAGREFRAGASFSF